MPMQQRSSKCCEMPLNSRLVWEIGNIGTGNHMDGFAAQMVDATLAWSLSAGVWNPKVFLGR